MVLVSPLRFTLRCIVVIPTKIYTLLYNTLHMVKEAIGKVFPVGAGNTRYISVPSMVATDDRFPFKDQESVRVRIEDGRVIVEKVE